MEIRFPFGFINGAVRPENNLNTLAGQHLYAMLATWEGERVMLPFYGGPFRRVLFDAADETTISHLIRVIMDSSSDWNKDLNITQIDPLPIDPEQTSTITLDIRYEVVKTGATGSTTIETDGLTLREVTV